MSNRLKRLRTRFLKPKKKPPLPKSKDVGEGGFLFSQGLAIVAVSGAGPGSRGRWRS